MVVCIAIGNTLRGDDGVAHYALRLIATTPDDRNRVAWGPRVPADQVRLLEVFQLTPELACIIAPADVVFFLDADSSAAEVVLAPIEMPCGNGSALAHSMSPAELVAIARHLYAFAGEAVLCRIPAKQFEFGEELTPQAKAAAESAAKMVTEYSANNCDCEKGATALKHESNG